MQFGGLKIEIASESENLTIFRLKGEITTDIYSEFVNFCKDKIEKTNTLLNFFDVTYISSAGIAALLHFNKMASDSDKRLILYGIHSSVKKIIELTKLYNMFNIVETEEEAIRILK